MNPQDALIAIQDLLDGVAWTPETLNEIAKIMIEAGYRIRDKNDHDLEVEDL